MVVSMTIVGPVGTGSDLTTAPGASGRSAAGVIWAKAGTETSATANENDCRLRRLMRVILNNDTRHRLDEMALRGKFGDWGQNTMNLVEDWTVPDV